MEEEDHFIQTQLPTLIAALAATAMAAGLLPLAAPLSLFFSLCFALYTPNSTLSLGSYL